MAPQYPLLAALFHVYDSVVKKTTRVYSYSGCGTCRQALKWLAARGIETEIIAIREQPPTISELTLAARQLGALRPLFNTSGLDYRSMKLKDRLAMLTDDEAIALLAANGNLVKRPFVVLPEGTVLVGWSEQTFVDALG